MTTGALLVASGGLLAAYLLGAVPFGYLAGRLRGIDVRAVGSGNIGATNVARALGKPLGIAVFILDTAKGYAAAGPLAWLVLDLVSLPAEGLLRSVLAPLYALAVCAGHNWTVFLNFRGGRGVATAAGVLLALAPIPAVAGLACWAILAAVFRYVSLASMLAAVVTAGLCVGLAAWNEKLAETWPTWSLTAVLAALIIVRHRANIGRLLKGQEPKIGRKSAEPARAAQPEGESRGS